MDIRTDLAIEWLDMAAGLGPDDWQQEETVEGGITLSTTRICTQAAAERIGKPVGQYLTASFSNLLHDAAQNTALAELLGEHLKRLLPEKGGVLVLGLGNPSITPDAVGPRAVEGVMATRHIGPALEKAMGISFRPVSALAPGVLGQTGVEVQEIARALVRDTAPAALVVIDALAAKATQRLGRTVQLSDAGIVPGSGVGNARSELSQNTLGIPVRGYKYTAMLICGGCAGLAGAYLSLDQLNMFVQEMTAGRGFIVLVMMALGKYTPVGTVLAALLFGFADALQINLQQAFDVPSQLVQMMPYIVTILVLTFGIKHVKGPAGTGKLPEE